MSLRCFAPFIAALLSIGGFTATARAAVDVPADYAALVPADAQVVIYIEDYGALQSAWRDMLPESLTKAEVGAAMPDLVTGFNLKTSVKLPADQPVIAWFDSLGDLMPTGGDGVAHIAFRMPGGTAENTSVEKKAATKGEQLAMHEGMAIVYGSISSDKKVPAYSVPTKAGNPLLKELPEGLVSLAIQGDDIGKLAQGIAPMASMAPMMLQQPLAERTKGMSKEDRAAVTKAQQGLMRDIAGLVSGATSSLQDITLATGAISLDGDVMNADLVFSIGGTVGRDHGVDPRLLSQMPSGRPLYLALDAPTVKWVAGFEMDLFEALFATDAASVRRFDAMVGSAKAAADLITGGYVVSTSNLTDAHTLVGTDRPKEMIEASGKLFDQMDGGDMAFTYTNTGKNSWDVKMDPTKLMNALGDAVPVRKDLQMPSGWTLTMTPGDRMVVAEQQPIGEAEPKKAAKTDTLDMLDRFKDSRIIVGLAIDVWPLITQAVEAAGAPAPKLPAELANDSTAVGLVIHSPDEKTVAIHHQLPMGVIVGAPALDAED